jgi:hypothetical protein
VIISAAPAGSFRNGRKRDVLPLRLHGTRQCPWTGPGCSFARSRPSLRNAAFQIESSLTRSWVNESSGPRCASDRAIELVAESCHQRNRLPAFVNASGSSSQWEIFVTGEGILRTSSRETSTGWGNLGIDLRRLALAATDANAKRTRGFTRRCDLTEYTVWRHKESFVSWWRRTDPATPGRRSRPPCTFRGRLGHASGRLVPEELGRSTDDRFC